MKILIFGATGMLGHKLYQQLGRRFDVYATVRGNASRLERYSFLDLSRVISGVDAKDTHIVRDTLRTLKPDVVVNAIGAVKQKLASDDWTDGIAVNAVFPQNLSLLTKESGARLITISTDCVFSGRQGNYNDHDIPDATDVYGISKRLGEPHAAHVLVLRTSFIGRELNDSHGLLEWFLENRDRTVRGYTRAIFSGVTTIALASVIERIILDHPVLSGVYHVSAEPISKYDLLVRLEKAFATGATIRPSDDVVVDRSLDSTAFRNVTGWEPPSWTEMLAEMAVDETPYERWRATRQTAA